jgi:hypothetical protein
MPLVSSSFIAGIKAGLRASSPLEPPNGVQVVPQLASPWADDSNLGVVSMVWSDLFGTDNLPMSRAEAMSVPAIARARNIVCATLARIPFTVTDRAGADVPSGTAVHNLDPAQAPFITKLWTVDDLVFHGVSWWLVTGRYSDPTNLPATFRRCLPGTVKADGGQPMVNDRPVQARDLVRIDGPHEGILNFASRSVRAARRLDESAARFADNPVPAIELHETEASGMTEAEIDALVAAWARARRGENGGVAYTSRTIEARVHGAPAENLLTDGRNVAAIDAARLVGVPADAVDASLEHAAMTYANVESRLRVLVDFGLAAYAAAIVSRLSMPDITRAGTTVGFAGLNLDELDTDPVPAGSDLSPAGTDPSTTGVPA